MSRRQLTLLACVALAATAITVLATIAEPNWWRVVVSLFSVTCSTGVWVAYRRSRRLESPES